MQSFCMASRRKVEAPLHDFTMTTSPPLTSRERALAIACVGLLLIASFASAVPQSATYHHFADQRGWLGVPFALDVLSNLPFALWGIGGLVGGHRLLRACQSV